MTITTLILNCLITAVYAAGMAIVMTVPVRFVTRAFFCAFVGRLVRDVLMFQGLTQNWSTLVAAAMVALSAVITMRRHVVSPVVLLVGVLPLGATVPMFNAVIGLLKVSTLQDQALHEACIALVANLGKLFTTSLAIAIGVAIGINAATSALSPKSCSTKAQSER